MYGGENGFISQNVPMYDNSCSAAVTPLQLPNSHIVAITKYSVTNKI